MAVAVFFAGTDSLVDLLDFHVLDDIFFIHYLTTDLKNFFVCFETLAKFGVLVG